MSVVLRSALRVAVFLSLATAVAGQPSPGLVVDESGARVPGATLVIRSEGAAAPAFEKILTSSTTGTFDLGGLEAGRYRISVLAGGFAPTAVEVDLPAANAIEIKVSAAPVIEFVPVVSASRVTELRESLNTRVDVISRSTLEESGAQTVAEALRDVPGVMSRRGSETAGAAGEQIQGIDSRQVLVLLDGQPLVAARGIKRGAVNLDRQPVFSLERVEIVKGASSALYGSDAIGGVISLVTRDPAGAVETSGGVSGGSHGTLDATVSGGFRQSPVSGFFSAERHQHDGFDLTPSTFDTTGAPFRRVDGLGKLRLALPRSWSASAIATGYSNRTTGRSVGELGPQEDVIDDDTLNAGLTVAGPIGGTTVQARAYVASYTERSTGRLAPPASTPVAPGALDEDYAKADLTAARAIGSRQYLQGGVEWMRNEYAGLNRLRDDARQEATTGVAWAQHRLALGSRATTTLGVRVDHHSAFGTAVSPKAAVNVRLAGGLHARASYGRGFRAPDLGQLYYRFLNPTNFYQVIGNPDLRPEEADSIQVGAEYVSAGRRARFGVNLFHNDVRDLIESVSLGFIATPQQLAEVLAREGLDPSFRPVLNRMLFTYKNVSDAATRGVEVDGEMALGRGFTLAGAYTYLDAFDSITDRPLTGRNRHQGHARVGWRSDRAGTKVNLRSTVYGSWIAARSGKLDTIAPRFALWDAYVSQRLVRAITAFAAVDNLANSRDSNTGVLQANGAPAPIYRPEIGRTFRFGVRWSWNR